MRPYLTANSILSIILRLKSCALPKNLPLIVWTWPDLCTGALPLDPTKPNCGSMLWCSLKCLSRFLTKSGNRATTDCIPCPSLLTKTTSTSCVEFCCHEEFFSTKTPSILQDAGEGKRESTIKTLQDVWIRLTLGWLYLQVALVSAPWGYNPGIFLCLPTETNIFKSQFGMDLLDDNFRTPTAKSPIQVDMFVKMRGRKIARSCFPNSRTFKGTTHTSSWPKPEHLIIIPRVSIRYEMAKL